MICPPFEKELKSLLFGRRRVTMSDSFAHIENENTTLKYLHTTTIYIPT